MKNLAFLLSVFCVLVAEQFSRGDEPRWQTLATIGTPTPRHEAAFIGFRDQLYLIGGRRINPVDRFDPRTKTWTKQSVTPLELHHFQAVVLDDVIYLVGAMTGRWPNETPLEKVILYDPLADQFEYGHTIPEERRRGGAGAVVYEGKIYVVGGITNGHQDGYKPWLDCYDPQTGEWIALDDAPHARDHFQAVVIGDRLYAVAGRTTSQRTNQGFDLTVSAVDVFDFKTSRWLPEGFCPDIPTLRAGNMAANVNGMLVVGGGECGKQKQAHDEVDVFDPATSQWTKWPSLQRGRHGSGFAVVDDTLYTASGSGNRGGGPELDSIEALPVADLLRSEPDEVSKEDHLLWHKKTLQFEGPVTSESAIPNPFTDYRLEVTFQHGDELTVIRGFYAADGAAAETSADSGNVWKAHFCPNRIGKWTWKASFRTGKNIAIRGDADAGTALELSVSEGAFTVVQAESRAASRSFYDLGRLTAKSGYFYSEGAGEYWMKAGANSPENLLAYADFDSTFRNQAEARDGEAAPPPSIHRYAAHRPDWKTGDPTWQKGKGKGLIGAVNYLASSGMNAVYFLTMNVGGDGNDVWPYFAPDQFDRFDCSKLDQWDIVFQHMQAHGILLHVVTQETENERLLDDGDCGDLRRLYYSELIARFAYHPGLIWNLGEENGPANFSPNGQTSEQQRKMAKVLKQLDPYDHPVVIHTHSTPESKDELLPALLDHRPLDGLSFQVNKPSDVYAEIRKWRMRARQSGHDWLISMDEIGKWDTGMVPDSVDANHDDLRRDVLWGSLMAGAAGIEWYFGAKQPHNDLNSEDWRQRENIWTQTRHAITFFRNIPYWKMNPADDLLKSKSQHCLALPGEHYVVYAAAKSSLVQIDLSATEGQFSLRWFNPRTGDEVVPTEQETVESGSVVVLHQPDDHGDWVAWLKR